MKLALLLIPLLFFMTSCTIDWNDEKDVKIVELESKIRKLETTQIQTGSVDKIIHFSNTNLGISFDSFFNLPGETYRINNSNEIIEQLPQDTNSVVSVYYLNEGESTEDGLKRLIASQGKDPSKCGVQYDEYFTIGKSGYKVFYINPIDDKFTYSKDEKDLLEKDKERARQDGGPIFADGQIYNKRVVDLCSSFAAPPIPATSKSSRAFFIYNNSKTLLFFPPSTDPSFINFDTLEIKDPESLPKLINISN